MTQLAMERSAFEVGKVLYTAKTRTTGGAGKRRFAQLRRQSGHQAIDPGRGAHRYQSGAAVRCRLVGLLRKCD